MKSIAWATHPLLACLAEAEKLAGGLASNWESQNPDGADFLRCCIPDMGELPLITEMKSRAARTAAEINRWLQEEGFSIQLPPDGDLFLASVMKLLVQWLNRGEPSDRIKGFSGVKLKMPTAKVIFEQSWPNDRYVVQISTKSPDDVAYMAIPYGRTPQNEWEVLRMIAETDNVMRAEGASIGQSGKHEGVIFPQVELDTEPDVSWLEGTRAEGNDGLPLMITKCLEQVKLKLDLEGARVEVAAAMYMTRGIGPVPYVIDRPFLFWIKRRGVTDPLVWAFLAEDSWVRS